MTHTDFKNKDRFSFNFLLFLITLMCSLSCHTYALHFPVFFNGHKTPCYINIPDAGCGAFPSIVRKDGSVITDWQWAHYTKDQFLDEKHTHVLYHIFDNPMFYRGEYSPESSVLWSQSYLQQLGSIIKSETEEIYVSWEKAVTDEIFDDDNDHEKYLYAQWEASLTKEGHNLFKPLYPCVDCLVPGFNSGEISQRGQYVRMNFSRYSCVDRVICFSSVFKQNNILQTSEYSVVYEWELQFDSSGLITQAQLILPEIADDSSWVKIPLPRLMHHSERTMPPRKNNNVKFFEACFRLSMRLCMSAARTHILVMPASTALRFLAYKAYSNGDYIEKREERPYLVNYILQKNALKSNQDLPPQLKSPPNNDTFIFKSSISDFRL